MNDISFCNCDMIGLKICGSHGTRVHVINDAIDQLKKRIHRLEFSFLNNAEAKELELLRADLLVLQSRKVIR